jgi:carboxyl-terminal processing protease
MDVRFRRGWVSFLIAAVATASWLGTRRGVISPTAPSPVPSTSAQANGDEGEDGDEAFDPDEAKTTSFRIPSGAPPALTCEDARRIVSQVREMLAYSPPPVRPSAFADGVIDWLDPHGLWSAAPGTPVAGVIARRAPELVRELEGQRGECNTSRELGRAVERWVNELRVSFQERRKAGGPGVLLDGAVFEPVVDGAPDTRTAGAFAKLLGDRVGAAERLVAAGEGTPFASAAEDRFFPKLDADAWARVVLAAAVRAYVPLLDPHGGWAPLEEEASIYEFDLDAHPRVELWEKVVRTAIGARIESGALPPLRSGDVVLSLSGVLTAGLAIEQLQELVVAVGASHRPTEAVVMRDADPTPRKLTLKLDVHEPVAAKSDGEEPHEDLPVERIAYGNGNVVVVAIHEVRDDLGEQLTRAILRERSREPNPPVGIVLDLRGNGGGSTDGAVDALGLLVPGVPLFPMRRRDGSIETERAPERSPSGDAMETWAGPVATFVDGNTASAAEMISGALTAYRRGPAVGRSTYGKGCAQEYADDDARAGVLRLTTLLYALPDGTAVQRVGLSPTLRFPFALLAGEDTSGESESKIAEAPPTWKGPDVRDLSAVQRFESAGLMTWPLHGGSVGPCKDGDVCRALHVLGGGAGRRISAAPKSSAR